MQTTNTSRVVSRLFSAALVIGLALTMFATSATATGSNGDDATPNVASFGDKAIDLSGDWGDAQACMVSPASSPECFATEAEMDAQIVALGGAANTTRFASMVRSSAFANCGVSLRLYDGGWYTGAVLYLSTRYVWLNLSGYNFNQKTSSFKVGACSTYMADFNNGGGGWFSTSATTAWSTRGSMGGGWNNDVSSVYIS